LRLRLKAVIDLQSQTEGGKLFQILGRTETQNALEPELRLWHGTDITRWNTGCPQKFRNPKR